MPERIQRRRTRGWRMPEGAVYVGRPTRWGNPFRAVSSARYSDLWERDRFLGQSTDPEWAQREAVARFALHIGPMGNYEYDDETLVQLRRELAGRDLVCWCKTGQPCHADVLLELANVDTETRASDPELAAIEARDARCWEFGCRLHPGDEAAASGGPS